MSLPLLPLIAMTTTNMTVQVLPLQALLLLPILRWTTKT